MKILYFFHPVILFTFYNMDWQIFSYYLLIFISFLCADKFFEIHIKMIPLYFSRKKKNVLNQILSSDVFHICKQFFFLADIKCDVISIICDQKSTTQKRIEKHIFFHLKIEKEKKENDL